MKKQLFFDDNKLFGRNNVTRKYGKPQLVSVYNDGACSTDYCTGYVFRLDNGKYRMLYFGHSNLFSGKKMFAAESCNGIDFTPECIHRNPSDCKKTFAHEIMDIPSEVACIYEDKHTDNPDELNDAYEFYFITIVKLDIPPITLSIWRTHFLLLLSTLFKIPRDLVFIL